MKIQLVRQVLLLDVQPSLVANLLREEAREMDRTTTIARMVLLVGFCVLALMVSHAKADDFDQKTTFTFSGPVEIPGKVLPAGTYVFKLVEQEGDRDVVQVLNKKENRAFGTFLTISDSRMTPTGKPVITFDERAAGSPEAVKAWFYPGDNYGHEFVYPKARALELAKANSTPVPSMPDELATNTTMPATTMKEQSVVAMKQASLKAQKPDEEEVEIAEVFVTPSSAPGLPRQLPKTASQLPLIGLFGLLAIGMAGLLRFGAAKTK
jgi:hypothetical protein